MTEDNTCILTVDIFENVFDHGHGKFSRWDAFRSWTFMDCVGFKKPTDNGWVFVNWRMMNI